MLQRFMKTSRRISWKVFDDKNGVSETNLVAVPFEIGDGKAAGMDGTDPPADGGKVTFPEFEGTDGIHRRIVHDRPGVNVTKLFTSVI
jgi:hypothetical protein